MVTNWRLQFACGCAMGNCTNCISKCGRQCREWVLSAGLVCSPNGVWDRCILVSADAYKLSHGTCVSKFSSSSSLGSTQVGAPCRSQLKLVWRGVQDCTCYHSVLLSSVPK